MKDIAAKKVFDQYNPKSEVVRCPRGRAIVRGELNEYAKAAVKLAGIIPQTELVSIYNDQTGNGVTIDEMFILLLPLVRKNEEYCFYQNDIVMCWMLESLSSINALRSLQSDKPRYLPERKEFLKHADLNYEDETENVGWQALWTFFLDSWPENFHKRKVFFELKSMAEAKDILTEWKTLTEEYGLKIRDVEHGQTFLDLLMVARNNTRFWMNKGYTPNELMEMMSSEQPSDPIPAVMAEQKVGMNSPCPCGSNKKYKKCCRPIETAGTAQLSKEDSLLFYDIWLNLLAFINDKRRVFRQYDMFSEPGALSRQQALAIREILWKEPELITQYLSSEPLVEEHAEILRGWRDSFIKGVFVIVAYEPDYALLLGSGDDGKDVLYGVKGITDALSASIRYPLPLMLDAVLLPFKDTIIYDSLLAVQPISFGPGLIESTNNSMENARRHGIITYLS